MGGRETGPGLEIMGRDGMRRDRMGRNETGRDKSDGTECTEQKGREGDGMGWSELIVESRERDKGKSKEIAVKNKKMMYK